MHSLRPSDCQHTKVALALSLGYFQELIEQTEEIFAKDREKRLSHHDLTYLRTLIKKIENLPAPSSLSFSNEDVSFYEKLDKDLDQYNEKLDQAVAQVTGQQFDPRPAIYDRANRQFKLSRLHKSYAGSAAHLRLELITLRALERRIFLSSSSNSALKVALAVAFVLAAISFYYFAPQR